ncbi:unnamed protein product [Cladocopium goreaui]|uniref:Protein-L-isoaspartate O-methyltransferase domain-containing protein 1 n=1 Tax=Cladocopium goreaui TaxID=2562237 RepID=A0A9P1GR80_9DINO|nr:unnamed protein product [Cladocopium goreaui]
MHTALHQRIMAAHEDEVHMSNERMVNQLRRSGALRSQACVDAFKAVDRAHFWIRGLRSEIYGTEVYGDAPLRYGKLHQSAPHIYARALEALMPLKTGMSFLNIGSGTGYFSSLVAEILGDGVNDGLELWPENVAHAQERCNMLGKHHITFNVGNVYQLDVNLGMRYSRIYVWLPRCGIFHGQVGLGLALLGLCAQAAKLHLEVQGSCDSFQCDLEKGWSPKLGSSGHLAIGAVSCHRPTNLQTLEMWPWLQGSLLLGIVIDLDPAAVVAFRGAHVPPLSWMTSPADLLQRFPEHVPVLVTVQLEGSKTSKKLLLPKTLKAGQVLAVLSEHVELEDKDIPWPNMQIQVAGKLPAAEQQMGEIWSSLAADVLPMTLQQLPSETPHQDPAGAASAKRKNTEELPTEPPRKRCKAAGGFGGIVVDVARMALWSLAGYILVGSEAAAAAGFTAACAKALM